MQNNKRNDDIMESGAINLKAKTRTEILESIEWWEVRRTRAKKALADAEKKLKSIEREIRNHTRQLEELDK